MLPDLFRHRAQPLGRQLCRGKSSKSDVKSDGKKEQARELRTLKPTATTTARPDPPPSPAKKQQLVSRQRPAQLVVSCESARAMTTRACSRRCAAHLGRSEMVISL